MTNIYASYKHGSLAIILLMISSFSIKAQIPNNGFESWTNMGAYENPDSWGTANSACSGSFHPVTKSTDHFPVSVGQYSIRLENNISFLPPGSYCGVGVAGISSPTYGPGFQITGHPNSLTGYYKFLPQGGDTMIISVQLFNQGVQVVQAELNTTVAAPNWTSFDFPISSYTVADSASIRISAYCTCGPSNFPHGNSVLFVDNLNFDNLITGISETKQSMDFAVFPNPAKGAITVLNMNPTGKMLSLSIRNSLGQEVYVDRIIDGRNRMTFSPSLGPGIYFVIISDENGIYFDQRIFISEED